MNARIQEVIFLIAQFLRELLRLNPEYLKPRHAEHLMAAGFGYPNLHAYLAASKAGLERCRGYYIPDSAMIQARMIELGYPPEVARQCVDVFARGVSNGGFARADMDDDLQGERQFIQGSGESMNHAVMVQNLRDDIMREESSVWTTLAQHGIPHDGETEDNLTCAIQLSQDFPSFQHLNRTVDVPFVARYDLEQGSNPEALFYKTNRRLEFRGNLRLQPSGKRGWAYPTIRLDETPFVDHRTEEERRGEYTTYPTPNIDERLFDEGVAAGRHDTPPPSGASFDFLAGWIMTAHGVNSTGHMSTGLIDRAFYGALENAKALRGIGSHEAFHLASQACRYLASTRIRGALEELIQEQAEDEQQD